MEARLFDPANPPDYTTAEWYAGRRCGVLECEKRHHSRGLCQPHYRVLMRRLRGRGPAPTRKPCTQSGCEQLAKARELCDTHYRRWRAHGDPGVVLRLVGPEAPAWRGDVVSYETLHQFIRSSKGSARDLQCTDCPSTAQHWSYVHGCSSESLFRTARGKLWPGCRHLECYQPRCISCHHRYDKEHAHGSAAV